MCAPIYAKFSQITVGTPAEIWIGHVPIYKSSLREFLLETSTFDEAGTTEGVFVSF
jgi:hypothetical protein